MYPLSCLMEILPPGGLFIPSGASTIDTSEYMAAMRNPATLLGKSFAFLGDLGLQSPSVAKSWSRCRSFGVVGQKSGRQHAVRPENLGLTVC